MINQKALTEGVAFEARSAWYLVNTKAGKERLAVLQLRQQGFETYLPMRAPLRAGGEARPLFPSYLFVRVDLACPGWRAIYSTFGVKDVLSVGEGVHRRPKALPTGLVPGFMAMERAGLIPLGAPVSVGGAGAGRGGAAKGAPATGERVLVPLGAAGALIEAVLVEHVDARRSTVLISMLGRDSKATVDSAALVMPSAVAVQRQAGD